MYVKRNMMMIDYHHFRDITKMVYKPYLIKQETKDEYK